MSTIRKKPYIEVVIGSLSDTQLTNLNVALNNGGNNADYGFGN